MSYSPIVMKTDPKLGLPGVNPDLDISCVPLGRCLEVFYDLAFFPYSPMLQIIRHVFLHKHLVFFCRHTLLCYAPSLGKNLLSY